MKKVSTLSYVGHVGYTGSKMLKCPVLCYSIIQNLSSDNNNNKNYNTACV